MLRKRGNADGPEGGSRAGGFGRAVERFNQRLRPYLGAPPLGPYDDEPVQEPMSRLCPMCGEPMPDHVIDRSGPRTQVRCPV
ncbi:MULTISPECIES: hypothetical protein [Clavibacter]|uniref:Type IV secretion protein Rhs n=1 Tax=Clavibacter tessellarius TaxID=31965 RepID=A0A154UYS6_9MICO|nr:MULTISPECIES: hypothetical protein [Clavibacter]KZC94227.1 hypothetical protein AWH51_14295 [Clavibacter michiganensis subsp. tessellarius]MDA3804210.1 hypothetical protein [Clavibacter sp. CT19]